ncbi:DUF4832 domain-containing protein [Pedobacter alpinus]|uniref:DUF4832 domain-containing protein n=1 Tax=Pedobacter alpinus TaxID=1590643 RepID=A0ABW5TUN9_9SPHI
MKQIFNFILAISGAIVLLSCEKDDFKDFSGGKSVSIVQVDEGVLTDTTNMQSINLVESLDLLLNPGKGFVKYYDYEEQYASVFSTKYIRYDWADIQPQEGNYNWNWINNEIAECKLKGKKFAFGIMCANTNRSINTIDKGKYVTPKWVFNAGAKSRTINATYWETGQTIKQVIPVWTDAVFINKLHQFIAALGVRYNGNPDIAFVDIRDYGNWGEQHLYELGGVNITSTQLKTMFILPYKNAFSNTQLINPWGEAFYNDTYEWAVDNKIGMRSDGIFKYSNGSETTRAHQKAPSVFEYTANYEWLTSENYWNADTLLSYIEIGKPSYIQFDTQMYLANPTLYTKIANRVGYHFVLKNVKIPKSLSNNQIFSVETSVLNKGVTKVYENCELVIALLDAKGNVIQKRLLNGAIPANWNSDQLTTEISTLSFNAIPNGIYQLAVGLFSDINDAKPAFRFANTNSTINNWYVLTNAITLKTTP